MRSRESEPIAPNVDVLDVRLLDLFAQVEALLRNARDVQRQMITLRGTSAPVSHSRRRVLTTKIRKAVLQIHQETIGLRTVVRNIIDAANDLDTANHNRRRKG